MVNKPRHHISTLAPPFCFVFVLQCYYQHWSQLKKLKKAEYDWRHLHIVKGLMLLVAHTYVSYRHVCPALNVCTGYPGEEKIKEFISLLCFKFKLCSCVIFFFLNILETNLELLFKSIKSSEDISTHYSVLFALFKLMLFWPKISTMILAPSICLSPTFLISVWKHLRFKSYILAGCTKKKKRKNKGIFFTSVFGSEIKAVSNPINGTAKGNFSTSKSSPTPFAVLFLFIFYFLGKKNSFEVRGA